MLRRCAREWGGSAGQSHNGSDLETTFSLVVELAESTIGLDAYPVRSKHHVGIHDRITVLPDLADDLGGQGQTLQTDLQIPGLLLERLELGLGFGSGLACLLGLLLQDRAGLLELTDFVSEVSDLLPCNRELVQAPLPAER